MLLRIPLETTLRQTDPIMLSPPIGGRNNLRLRELSSWDRILADTPGQVVN